MLIVMAGPETAKRLERELLSMSKSSVGFGLFDVPFEIRVDPLLVSRKQFRFPKSRAKRIRKKWSKSPANFKNIEDTKVYLIDNNPSLLWTQKPSEWGWL